MGLLNKIGIRRVNELIGVDIGSSSIKICCLKGGKGAYKVAQIARKFYEDDLLNEGQIIDKEFIARELKEILAENKIKSKYAATALSSYVVITKEVTLPFLEEEELENSISFEVENAIPFPLKDVYFSHYVLGMSQDREDMINVQIAASKKEIVDGYMDTFNLAGLNLQILDVDIFGITNLVELIYSPKNVSVLAVDVGASTTNMAIMRDANIQFTREILLGGKSLSQQIARMANMSFAEAEAKKIGGNETVSHLFDDFIYGISSEINKTINFYVSIKPKETISKIYLSGGSSLLKGLKEKVQEETRVDVEYVNPFLLVDPVPENMAQYDDYKVFNAVALWLSSRISDLA